MSKKKSTKRTPGAACPVGDRIAVRGDAGVFRDDPERMRKAILYEPEIQQHLLTPKRIPIS